MQEWGGVGRSSENFLCCLQHSKFKQHHTFNWLRAKKKAGLLRAIICVKALSTSHCLGGCNFGAELGTNLYMRAEDLSCNSPLRCCDLQLKFHFGIQITWPYCKPKGEKKFEFLDRKFHRIFPKISKISSIYTKKKKSKLFSNLLSRKRKFVQNHITSYLQQMFHHGHSSFCFNLPGQGRAIPYYGMVKSLPIMLGKVSSEPIEQAISPMNPSILPSIYPQWWYCTSFEIAQFAHHSSPILSHGFYPQFIHTHTYLSRTYDYYYLLMFDTK